MHWLAALIILAQLVLPFYGWTTRIAAFQPPHADSPTIEDLGVSYTFGEVLKFQAQVKPDTGVKEILVFISPENQPTVWQKMILDTTGTVNSEVNAEASVDVRQIVLYPFSQVKYHYEATLDNGSKVTSDSFDFTYDDSRFTWQELKDSTFQVSWSGTDASLGQEMLNDAEDGLQRAQSLLTVDKLPTPIRIYAYKSSRDLQSALQLTNMPWIAGHSIPEVGLVLISVPSGPEKKLELQRQIPHELMHILQYQIVGKQYTSQPVWLMEGMASLAEPSQNPEYRRTLETAAQTNQLLPMSSLCLSFPPEAGSAFQAYAQSESFVRFLHQKYGASGLRKLIDVYKNGQGCEEGFATAIGTTLRQAEYRWQQESLGMNTSALVLSNLSPYLLVGLLIILIPVATLIIPSRVHKPVMGRNGT